MNGSLLDPSESELSPLGPAISPRLPAHASSIGQMAEPLAPFGSRVEDFLPQPMPTRQPAPAPTSPPREELDAIDSGSGAVDDLPWLPLDGGDPAAEDADEEEPDGPWLDELADLDFDDLGDRENLDPQRARWSSPPADWAYEAAPPPNAADAVAEQLEEIARTLRDQGSAGLLVRHVHDPLQLLIAGYALGYAAAMDEVRGGEAE
jgi:hypothetical protein